ncbi:hypothetical protein SARC_04289 [Sphaeroforma arctica JP610]|uniref:VTC domain-containing protein n=1 Tax=Sphaeroforma arctica JP610 TaxID=667725 RepID=A0A0L0G2T8_9EUKA|nr:hypothetical protein SARC_04289 [Sphaeroforma arctica JP610]KNC83447.1 hypothetical protein SARC_04289 [Sphaeroforma arctica JP610]|eukprot:XP_014157349.1 hypothetical protein SARC_04289 [Sphaeroforma arctica JP610]
MFLKEHIINIEKDSKVGGDEVFVRKSIKYVVPNELVDQVVAGLSERLPISPFRLAPDCHVMSQVNSSTYFDDESLTHLKERIVKNESAELYRIRWYGEDLCAVRDVFVERKRHHCFKEVGIYSNKKRMTLPKEQTTRYLLGADVDELLVDKAKLASDMQEHLLYLRPRIRTQYARTSFMDHTEGSDLRVTLDQNIVLALEPREGWRAILASNGALLGPQVTMPFSIIEVKVAMVPGGTPECPKWIAKVLESAMAQNIKISKYGYGCKLLIPEHASPTPKYWPELEAFINSSCGMPRQPNANAEQNVRKVNANSVELSQDFSIDMASSDFPTRSLNPFTRARAHGFNRVKYGKTETKAFMANERTHMKFVTWTTTLATFAVGFAEIGLRSSHDMLAVSMWCLIFTDLVSIYSVSTDNLYYSNISSAKVVPQVEHGV